AHVTVLASTNIAPIWKLIAEVDDIISVDTGSIFSVVGAIRGQPAFDAAILFPNSLRSALEVWLSRIPRRVGYKGHCRSWLLNQIVRERKRPGPLEHQARRYLRIAHSLGGETEKTSIRFPMEDADSLPWDADSVPCRPAAKQDGKWILGLCPG